MRYLLIILLLNFYNVLVAQSLIIKGQFVDFNTEEPIPHATIMVKDYLNGTTSDRDGRFLFSTQVDSFNLIVSWLGYFKMEIQNITKASYDTLDLGYFYLIPLSNNALMDKSTSYQSKSSGILALPVYEIEGLKYQPSLNSDKTLIIMLEGN